MTPSATSTVAASPEPAPRGAGVWARPMIEEDLAALARLRDAALAMGEALVELAQARARPPEIDEATGEAAPPPPIARTHDLPLAFSRVARAVRLTIALRGRLIEELEQLDELQGRRSAHRDADARAARKSQVARILTRIIHDEVAAGFAPDDDLADDPDADPDADDAPETAERAEPAEAAERPESEGAERFESEGETCARLVRAASEALRDVDRYGDVLARPVSDFIALVCRDLGLSPDWPRLAREAWAREELASGRVGEALISPLSLDGRGGGVRVMRRRPRTRPPMSSAQGGDTIGPLTPSHAPQAAPPPPPIPAPTEGDCEVEARSSKGVEIVGLPGEYPPPRRPRPH